MKNLLNIILILIVGIVVSSCEKDISINLPTQPESYVIEGWINSDETPIILISKTYPAYGSINLFTLIDSLYIKGAEVFVSSLGQTLQLAEKPLSDLPLNQQYQVAELFQIPKEFVAVLGNMPVYTDTTGTVIGQFNTTYDLEVFVNGKVLTASTLIPQLYPIDSLSFIINEDIDTLATVYLHITVPDQTDRFVRYANSRNGGHFIFPRRTGFVFDNGVFSGAGSLKLPIERGYTRDEDPDVKEFGLFAIGDTVTLRWQNISRATYDFWYTLSNDGGDTPFSSPVDIKTNVNGGFGIWAGYATSYHTIIVQ
jgi:hypothetical protein